MADFLFEQLPQITRQYLQSRPSSELLDDAHEQGERYYRQGARPVSNIDGSRLGLLVLGGALGYGLAWLIRGQQSYSGRSRTRHYGFADDSRMRSGRHHR